MGYKIDMLKKWTKKIRKEWTTLKSEITIFNILYRQSVCKIGCMHSKNCCFIVTHGLVKNIYIFDPTMVLIMMHWLGTFYSRRPWIHTYCHCISDADGVCAVKCFLVIHCYNHQVVNNRTKCDGEMRCSQQWNRPETWWSWPQWSRRYRPMPAAVWRWSCGVWDWVWADATTWWLRAEPKRLSDNPTQHLRQQSPKNSQTWWGWRKTAALISNSIKSGFWWFYAILNIWMHRFSKTFAWKYL